MKNKVINKIALKLLDKYSCETKNSKKRCRYIPTCSQYSKQCFEKFNWFKALCLTILRVLKCNPLFKGGYNPIPLTKKEKNEIKSKLPKQILDDKFNPFNMYHKIRY